MSEPNRIPRPINNHLKKLEMADSNLESEISNLFKSEHDLVTHYSILESEDSDLALFSKNHLAEKKIAFQTDYLLGTGFGTYVAEKKNMKKELVNMDGEKVEIQSEFILSNKAQGIVKIFMKNEPEQDETPIFLTHVSGGRCWILGYSFVGKERLSGLSGFSHEEFDSLNYGTDLLIERIHDIISSKSTFNVRVFTSIYDRIKNDNYSFPSDFITKTWGILKEPSTFSFSPKVEKELGLEKDANCTLFRDAENIFITIREDFEERLIKIPFTTIINSNNKIKSKMVQSSIKRNMALNRDGKRISVPSVKNKIKKIDTDEKISKVGMSFRMKSFGVDLSVNSIYTADSQAEIYSKLVPQLIFLRFAKYSEDLWNKKEVKRVIEKSYNDGRNIRNNKTKHNRILNWGSDRISYISLNNSINKIGSHWVNSHTTRKILKRDETILRYKERGAKLFKEDGKLYGICFIQSYFKGGKNKSNWDGTFNFGNRPRNYSKMAINWLEWIMRNENIMIQHAELGGEKRLQGEGFSYLLDGWCEENMTVYEFHGDLFHGNPDVFLPDERCNPFRKDLTAKELHEKTLEKEEYIRSLGLNLVTIWENDWKNIQT